MKKVILSVIIIAAVANFTSCKKESIDCSLVSAKIIRYDCDRVIFKLLNTENTGDPDWLDVQTGARYNNVVSYYNICAIASLTNGSMDTLYVQIKKDNLEYHSLECIQCKAISTNPPQTKVDFTEISKSPCTTQSKGR